MNKTTVGSKMLFYPRPVFLVGSVFDGKPDFMVVAGGAGVNSDPLMMAVSINLGHHTLKGVSQNMEFSVNVPSAALVKETDYCGQVSGANVDKVEVCRFGVYFKKLKNAPLIEQCPVNIECSVAHILELGTHALVIGKAEEIYFSEDCISDGKPDLNKVNPMIYTTQLRHYMKVGEIIGESSVVSQELKERK